MLIPTLRIIGAILAFGIPAYLATRLRMVRSKGGKRGTTYVQWWQVGSYKSKAARAYVNRLLLRMGWAWPLLCAPLLAYLPDSVFDLKLYIIILLGCLLLGVILSGVTYHQIEKIGSVDSQEDIEERLREQGFKIGDEHRAWINEARARDIKSMHTQVPKSNLITLLLVILAALLTPLLRFPAIWAIGLSTTLYVVFAAGVCVLVLIVHTIMTLRSNW